MLVQTQEKMFVQSENPNLGKVWGCATAALLQESCCVGPDPVWPAVLRWLHLCNEEIAMNHPSLFDIILKCRAGNLCAATVNGIPRPFPALGASMLQMWMSSVCRLGLGGFAGYSLLLLIIVAHSPPLFGENKSKCYINIYYICKNDQYRMKQVTRALTHQRHFCLFSIWQPDLQKGHKSLL